MIGEALVSTKSLNAHRVEGQMVFKRWRDAFVANRATIDLENQRLGGVSRMLRKSLGSKEGGIGRVLCYLIEPGLRAALVQRGAWDTPTEDPPDEFEFVTKERRGPHGFSFEYTGNDYYAVYLGMACPLGGYLCEAAIKACLGPSSLDKQLKLSRAKDDSPLFISAREKLRPLFALKWDNIYSAKACKSLEDRIARTQKVPYWVFVPVKCWGQVVGVWVFGCKTVPGQVLDVSALFESLALERFPLHCTHIANVNDESERYNHLLKGSATLWKAERLFALDENLKVFCEAEYPPPPQGRGVSFGDPLEYRFHAPSALPSTLELERLVVFSLSSEGAGEGIRRRLGDKIFAPKLHFEESDAFVRSRRDLFKQLSYIVWELDPQTTDRDSLKTVFPDEATAIGRAIVRGINAICSKQQEIQAATDRLRADLGASFSHRYVKDATHLSTFAKRIEGQARSGGTLRQLAEIFSCAVENYKHEMEMFSLIAQGACDFKFNSRAELDTKSQVLLFRPIVEALLSAFLLAEGTPQFEQDWASLTGCDRSRDCLPLFQLYDRIAREGYASEENLEEALKKLGSTYKHPKIEIDPSWKKFMLCPPPSDTYQTGSINRQDIFLSCFSKIL